jgi:hypothetical protein|tara:strand:- start:4915 stop:5148 length:234 start_codon:yes stop_codon:yes gene_type:complete
MSNEEKTVWLETFWERLNDKCKELNEDKYSASDLVDFLEGHYNFSVDDLMADKLTPTQAVDEAIDKYDEWLEDERGL